MSNASAKRKPNCVKGTACGYSCISAKLTCSDKILKRDADALLKSVGAQAIKYADHDYLPSLTPTKAEKESKLKLKEQSDLAFNRLTRKLTEITGLSLEQAEKSTAALQSYVGLHHVEIRLADAGLASADLEYIEKAKDINVLLDKLPSYGGSVHRGLSFKNSAELDAFVSSAKVGLSLDAMSSFSSSKDIALDFTKKSNSVLLSVKTNKTGRSVSAFNRDVKEDEVLVQKGAAYKTVGVSKDSKGLTVIELEEV